MSSYADYKPSGVEWLGDIPKHWSWALLRWISKRYAGGTPDKANNDYWENGTIPWLNSGEVNQFNITSPTTFITEEAYKNSSAKWVPKNSLIIALAGQGKTKGMVAQTFFDTTCNQSMATVLPLHDNPRYILYWLASQYRNIRSLAGDEARDGLNLEMIGSIPCPRPPIDEQQAIVRFLDDRTAQIDTLIAKKQRLLDLLAEKRSALITQAVTKGLNPNAPLKPSGVAWLGDIPAHWAVKAIRFLLKETKGAIKVGPFGSDLKGDDIVYDGDYDLFNQRTVLDNIFDKPDKTVTAETFERLKGFEVFENDVLVTTRGTIGKAALVPQLSRKAVLHPCLIRMQINQSQVLNEYILYFINDSKLFLEQVSLLSNATTIDVIYSDTLKAIEIPCPSIQEQVQIITHLTDELKKFNKIHTLLTSAIEKLKEYRASLITSAVTGKIKVV